MNSKTWTPPPKMPDDLPPLPMGRNGRPLVYCGKSYGKKGESFRGYLTTNEPSNKWLFSDYWGCEDSSRHYAAESDSEVCRLNQWGDFTPEAQKELVKAAQSSTLQTYLEAIESAIEEADQEWQKAVDVAAAWAEELAARHRIRHALQGEGALTRRQWYMAGRNDERRHAKVRTKFPLSP